MPCLSEYTNVFDTALSVLRTKGFQCWYDEASSLYFAERDGWDFASESPVGLLGVVAIYEFKNPQKWTEYWWKEEVPEAAFFQRLPRSPVPYVSVMIRSHER
jgi:hypothetical protein